jgi:U3 small nucleolar RNA-associated protein 10
MAAASGGADDRHSRAVAAAALAAVAPTWLAAGRSVRELWSVAVASLPTVPPHRRLMLLGSLLAALPEVSF